MSRRNPNKKRMSKKDRELLHAAANDIFATVQALNAQFILLGLPLVSKMEDGVANLSKLYINIVDFVNGVLRIFPNYYVLRDYSLSTRKIFPLNEAKSMGLRNLLVKFY